MKTAQEYRDSLKSMESRIYFEGERITDVLRRFEPPINKASGKCT